MPNCRNFAGFQWSRAARQTLTGSDCRYKAKRARLSCTTGCWRGAFVEMTRVCVSWPEWIDHAATAHIFGQDVLTWKMETISRSKIKSLAMSLENCTEVRTDRDRPSCRSSTEKPDPVQCYLGGLGLVYQASRDGINNVLAMFRKANELDPEFAPAYGMAAYCYVQRQSMAG